MTRHAGLYYALVVTLIFRGVYNIVRLDIQVRVVKYAVTTRRVCTALQIATSFSMASASAVVYAIFKGQALIVGVAQGFAF